ncbi:MAG: class I adenylate-forming enzyme family protein [Acidimicrobiales bacterium]
MERTPDALFGVDEQRREVTFAQLGEAALRVAAGLAARGIDAGSVVSWQLPSWIEAATLTLALCRLGATQNPLIPILRSREVGFICRQAGTSLLIVPGTWRGFDYEAMARGVAADVPRMDILVADRRMPEADASAPPPPATAEAGRWYFYTSGTTADPKGATHTDTTLLAATGGFVDALGLSDRDRVSLVIPITHIGGIIHVLASLVTGGASVFAEVFDGGATALHLRESGATIVPGGPPFVRAFLDFEDGHPDLRPLFPRARAMTHGGSPKPPSLVHQARDRFGLPIVSGYGMTECPMSVWNRPEDDDDDLATTEGEPVPGVDLLIVKQDEERAAAGEEGEVRLRGPQLMTGYVDGALDASAFDDAGYFRSGDLGTIDERGRVNITGRMKDIIIRNMENISATEVENLLYTHPKVAEVAVIGISDPVTGEHACAVVVPANLHEPPRLPELQEHLRAAGLSDRKLPEQLELIDALPRNAMEKVQKADLRRRYDTALREGR